jgi:hypothetical protein
MRLTRRGERLSVALALVSTLLLLGFVGWVEAGCP